MTACKPFTSKTTEEVMKACRNECFYCLKRLNQNNTIIDHTNNNKRERCSNDEKYAVASCKECSKKKGDMTAYEFQDKVLQVAPRCQEFTRDGYRCKKPVMERRRRNHSEFVCPKDKQTR
ncbi:unnamed protein product [Darwinula stevensoni]|uniref:Uncharacterized protein n=1 Tax=Darwinula stevensoni TaxID=69355 RepID=A0A7R8X0Z3_9CRUS|nr:unnamed protein product [Darwinula stevensoni]CAG0882275.1 unnamed protein product [Darwinula stevensoni]